MHDRTKVAKAGFEALMAGKEPRMAEPRAAED
jgi:hypothetical protein